MGDGVDGRWEVAEAVFDPELEHATVPGPVERVSFKGGRGFCARRPDVAPEGRELGVIGDIGRGFRARMESNYGIYENEGG